MINVKIILLRELCKFRSIKEGHAFWVEIREVREGDLIPAKAMT